jgi:hypothetical protein
VIFVSELFVVVAHSVGHFKEGAFCLVTDLFDGDGSLLVGDDGVGVGVVTDGKGEDFACVLGDDFGFEGVVDALLDEDLGDGHKILSEGTGFVRADIISTTHGFTGLQISDQVILLFHFSY